VRARAPGAARTAALFVWLVASGFAPVTGQGLPDAPGASPTVASCPDPGPLTAGFEGALAHVRYLADERLAGRAVASAGERCASGYLAERFRALGLLPAGDPGDRNDPHESGSPGSRGAPDWFHTFPVRVGARLGAADTLEVPGTQAPTGGADRAWSPFGFSGTGRVRAPLVYAGHGLSSPGTEADAGARVEVAGRIMVVESGDPDAPGRSSLRADPHFKARVAAGRGAAALVVLLGADDPTPEVASEARATAAIPVLWVAGGLADQLRSRAREGVEGTVVTEVHPVEVPARNVVALLPGSDPTRAREYVVVGAHYDHLGHGAGGIHHGADDNASGTAALLEIAARLASGTRPARPVLFVAFTGEEQGLWGSRHFVERPPLPLDGVVAMINLDMVGRLEQDSLAVFGTGTAPEWSGILAAANARVARPIDFMELASGDGPSDHASFHAAGIPVLHFFTGLHEDYHRPTDTWDRVDADGLERIIDLATEVVRSVAEGWGP